MTMATKTMIRRPLAVEVLRLETVDDIQAVTKLIVSKKAISPEEGIVWPHHDERGVVFNWIGTNGTREFMRVDFGDFVVGDDFGVVIPVKEDALWETHHFTNRA